MPLHRHRVDHGRRALADLAPFAATDVLDEATALAEPLRGLRIAELSSAPVSAALLDAQRPMLALMAGLGIEVRSEVLTGDAMLAATGAGLRDGIRAGESAVDDDAFDALLSAWIAAAPAAIAGADVVVVHDPEALPALALAAAHRSTAWVASLQVDASAPEPQAAALLGPLLRAATAVVVPTARAAPPGLDRPVVVPAGIDPLAARHLDLPYRTAGQLCKGAGVDLERPFVLHVADLDAWADPESAITVWEAAREQVPGLQLVIAGRMLAGADGAWQLYGELGDQLAGIPDVLLRTTVAGAGDAETGAFERLARVALRGGLDPAAGIAAAAAGWRRTPVAEGSGTDAARDVVELIRDPGFAADRGAEAREHVAANRLVVHQLLAELRLLGDLTGRG